MIRVALLGATGFVGSAVADAMAGNELEVVGITSPRLRTDARRAGDLIATAARHDAVQSLAQALHGCQVVVNAAGDPDASSLDADRLFGANALIPRVVLEASARAGVERFVHISSAVVQNDKAVLDESEDLRPFSPYSASKVAGEEVLRDHPPDGVTVVRYRPPSVHAQERQVTRMIRKIARSRVATVARPGDQPSPQALLPNVGAAVSFLVTSRLEPPAVVIHPFEGVTSAGLMRDLSGGGDPVCIPRWLAKLVVATAKFLGRLHQPTAANARRVEILWFGQGQSPSWLTGQGFVPPVGPEGWSALGNGPSEP